jgi:hypothetical protein
VEKGIASGDTDKVRSAKALQARIDTILNSDSHKWFLGKMDPEEEARRKKAAEQFKARYADQE